MAKKKAVSPKTAGMKAQAHGGPEGRSARRDALQAAANRQINHLFGGDAILNQEQAELRCGGIALPSLCLRWLFHNEAMPLSRVLTVAGLFGSCKTAMAFEISRWIVTYGGYARYYDVEQKDSPGLRRAIYRQDPELLKYISRVDCESQQQWQGAVSMDVDGLTPGKDGVMDVLGVGIVDSVAAAKPQEEREKFLKEKGGAGARGYASMALLNSDWVTHITGRIGRAPYLCLLIQHSNEVQVDRMPGVTKITHKGGAEIGFAKTVAIEMKRLSNLKEGADNSGGMNIAMSCSKNSLGPTHRKIVARARWGYQPNPVTGELEQLFLWDWHASTIDLLLTFDVTDGKKTLFKNLSKIVDLHKCKAQTVWSRALGIPESSPVSYSEAGEILEYDHPHLLPELYKLLAIERRPILPVNGDLGKLWRGEIPILDVPQPAPYPRGCRLSNLDDAEDS